MDENLPTLLKLAERPVKKILYEYFSMFLQEKLLDICEENEISTKRIPQSYIDLAKMIKLISTNDFPIKTINKNSLLKIPDDQDTIKIMMPNDDLFHLYLVLVNKNITWNDDIFKPFGADTENIKKEVGVLMNTAMFVFNYLQLSNPELKTLTLETDPSNVTLMLKDSLLPKYIHPTRISFTIN